MRHGKSFIVTTTMGLCALTSPADATDHIVSVGAAPTVSADVPLADQVVVPPLRPVGTAVLQLRSNAFVHLTLDPGLVFECQNAEACVVTPSM